MFRVTNRIQAPFPMPIIGTDWSTSIIATITLSSASYLRRTYHRQSSIAEHHHHRHFIISDHRPANGTEHRTSVIADIHHSLVADLRPLLNFAHSTFRLSNLHLRRNTTLLITGVTC